MTLTLLLTILGVTCFLSVMGFAIALAIRPGIVRTTERFVCPAGTKMEVEIAKLSYHRPGERGIVVSCRGPGKDYYVNAKAFLYLWLMFFVASLLPATLLGMLLPRWIPG